MTNLVEIIFMAIAVVFIVVLLFILRKERGNNSLLKEELNRIERVCLEGFQSNRQELSENLTMGRTEQVQYFQNFTESNMKILTEFGHTLSEESRKNRQETLKILENEYAALRL